MNKSSNSLSNGLWTIVKIYLAVDAVWAIIVATFASVLASQGLSLSGSGAVAATGGGVGAWLFAFVAAMFQGGIFLVVFSVFAALISAGAVALSQNNPPLRRFMRNYALGCLILCVVYALLMGSSASALLAHVGIQVGAAANATTLGAVLLWIIGFVAAFCQGSIFLTVFTLIVVAILFVRALLKN